MSVGGKARELLSELKRSDWLPPYNEEGVHSILQACHGHNREIDLVVGNVDDEDNEDKVLDEIPDEYRLNLKFHHSCIIRNKRSLLAYMNYRLRKIQELRWCAGAAIPSHLVPKLSPQEVEFFSSYDNILSEYMSNYPNIDLLSTETPPKDICIEVLVLQDCGEVMTDDGPVNLEAGTRHFLRRMDIDQLLRQGKLRHLVSDEDIN